MVLSDNELQTIQSGVFGGLDSLELLDLYNNTLQDLEPNVIEGLMNLTTLVLSYNPLHHVHSDMFESLSQLTWLDLQNISLCEIPSDTFASLRSLERLFLSSNQLVSLPPDVFTHQTKLGDLTLDNNQLSHLSQNIFSSLAYLQLLNLSANNLNELPMLSRCTSLKLLYLQENPLLWIHSEVFSGLNETMKLLVTNPAVCCYAASHVQCISDEIPSPFLTCERLLTFDFLQIIMWFISIFGIFGNITAMYIGYKQRQQRRKVQHLLITNLSISDLTMCIYLVILLSADLYYTDYFPLHSQSWRKSVLCRFAGALSVLSSEASTFFITLISIDRFFGIKYPFGSRRVSTSLARILSSILWTVAATFSITTFVLSGDDTDIYRVSEVCVGLPISKSNLYNTSTVVITIKYGISINENIHVPDQTTMNTHDSSHVSMYLSIAMFTGLNLVCFSIVGFCYTAIFIEARKSTKDSGQSQRQKEEVRMALKMSVLVLSDFCCWVPVGILSILVQAGVVEVSPRAYAWIATFVLPINSALNPFLYTFVGFSFDKIKCPCKKSERQVENIPMQQITHQK